MSKKLNSGSREQTLQVADLGFKICQKNALFGAVWVPKKKMPISIGTNQHDEQTPLIIV